jgi:putative tricarboxylic transport membrane protein
LRPISAVILGVVAILLLAMLSPQILKTRKEALAE